jgi:DNA-binding GntR family transcriptional regulator
LRREILTLELEPGASLDETSLSARFNVSRSPIREVLTRLQAERLVQTLPNRTTIVAPVDILNFSSFIEALDLQQRFATRLAARNRSSADLLKLHDFANSYQENVRASDVFGILQGNFEFHVSVAEAGKNPYVIRQYSELLSQARRLLHIHIKFLDASAQQQVLTDQHFDFIDAIEARDVVRADAVAHAHTMQFHDRFLGALKHTPDAEFLIEPKGVTS